ncbi:MAG: type 12 methyltransferase [Elusimicrobia bacterium]|nr:MAG: type 12 methyltransferase [Elusimicrobiota bacterium]
MQDLDFYARPGWYDALHAEGTASWADWLLVLNRRHGTGGVRWLEPACGTGRFFPVLARRGVRLTGYDLHPTAVAYARRRGDARLADMTGYLRPRAFDLAFCLLGSFRHLMDEAAARRHLTLTRRSLKPRGLYALGLDLCDYSRPEADEEVWTARRGGLSIEDVVETVPPDRLRRRERVIHFLRAGGRLYKSEYDLRSYDWPQFQRTFRAAGFRLAGAYDAWRRPVVPDRSTRDALFLLSAEG